MKFITILFCLIILYSGIMTAVFNDKVSTESYKSFGFSFRTLFSSSLGGLNMEIFIEQRYFGEIMLAIFLLLSYVLLIQLLIALLSNVYEDLVERVDGEYRAVLVNYFNRWSWNDKYGVMILLPPPLTWFTLLVAPFVIFNTRPERWNTFFSKICFLLYAIPQFCIFIAGSLFYLPFLYFQGFISYGKTGKKKHDEEQSIFKDKRLMPSDPTAAVLHKLEQIEQEDNEDKSASENLVVNKFSFQKAFVWTFIGLPWLLIAFFRDLGDFWNLVYLDLDSLEEENEKTRVQGLMNERIIKDLQRVIKRIQKTEISVKDFHESWVAIDQAQLNPALAEDEEALKLRHQTFNEYLLQLANNRKS